MLPLRAAVAAGASVATNPIEDDRRHVKQTLRHRCGLTRRVGSELLSSSRLLGAGFGATSNTDRRHTGKIPADRNNGRLSSVTRRRIYVN